MNFQQTVEYLESLQLMPKTMPGLDKIKRALLETSWFSKVDPNKVIIVAGTNGKGTTCAALQTLLASAEQRVGFYSSPHLVSTVERIQINGKPISENDFVELFDQNKDLIKKFQLSHFEALTLMAGHYFFSDIWSSNLDFVIFEVGLGGTYDATNAFPHKYGIVTKLGLDHVNILGDNICEIAKNKFGIVTKKSIIVHHVLPTEVFPLKLSIQKETNSNWLEAEKAELVIKNNKQFPVFFIKYQDMLMEINLPGMRAVENIMSAITMFHVLGFDIRDVQNCLKNINWMGRMQQLQLTNIEAPVFLSGDHNEQGIDSLVELLRSFQWKTLHVIVGVGIDKDCEAMLRKICMLRGMKLYLTETPFKGLSIEQYPKKYLDQAEFAHADIFNILSLLEKKANHDDLVLITGSLYLVGKVLERYK